MFHKYAICIVIFSATLASAQPTKCDQTPLHAKVPTPSEDKGLFHLSIANAKETPDGTKFFTSLQTYVLTLETRNRSYPFRGYMITAEDPNIDNDMYLFGHETAKVGNLKTLDSGQSRYSERCANSVESSDNSDKYTIQIHWVSPENTDRVRIRAMVAENSESWYIGENLTIMLTQNKQPALDSPPIKPNETCNLCSEARYEVIFKGRWSRLTHPQNYPKKPDDNGYSHMVGASHAYHYKLWEQGTNAKPGMQKLAEDADTNLLEREIIDNMSVYGGTRTMIRGKRRKHPLMSEPSHALFRVDRIHHLFSIAIAIKPSPDWFLGTNSFELCTDYGWLDHYEIPLYPWDAGTKDGVSYESPTSMTQPVNNIERVEVGSFNRDSPFYQINLNDLKPFAMLEVRRLDVYELDPIECIGTGTNEDANEWEQETREEPEEEPMVAESKQQSGCLGEWSEWSPCVPDVGDCGIGAKTRTRQNRFRYDTDKQMDQSCQSNDENPMEIKHCYIEC